MIISKISEQKKDDFDNMVKTFQTKIDMHANAEKELQKTISAQKNEIDELDRIVQ